MGVTIFYKGKLKEQYTPKEVFEIIKECLRVPNWKYSMSSKKMNIKINQESEDLVLYFNDGTIDEFCKISDTAPVIFDLIYDMFYNIIPLFETIEISDDIDIVENYLINRRRTGKKYIIDSNMTDEKVASYFKKQNKCTLIQAFKEVFKSDMERNGFKYCTKLQAFIKVVNEEVIQYMSIEGVNTNTSNAFYRFRIGMFSIYVSYSFKKQDLINIYSEYSRKDAPKESPIFSGYFFYHNENLYDLLKYTLEETLGHIIPKWNEVCDLESYYKYTKNKYWYMFKDLDKSYNMDAYVLLKLSDKSDYSEAIENLDKQLVSAYGRNSNNLTPAQVIINNSVLEPRDRVLNDKELYDEAIKEMERRKEYNLAMLKKLKVIE